MDIEQEIRRMLGVRAESLQYLTKAIGEIAQNECSKIIRKLIESGEAHITIDWKLALKEKNND